MSTELEQQIDAVWGSSLEKLIKKDVEPIRPSLGDFVDLYVPQIRTLLLIEANPAAAKFIYDAAYTSANRNTFHIMKRLGMPADYFWKFEYWPRERALETLRKVINKVFSSMMNRAKEGGLELQSVEVDPVKMTITFNNCVECAGIVADKPVCFYHTATFTGIMSSLLNREMSGFETECRAKGDSSCVVVMGKKEDAEIAAKVSTYLAPVKIKTSVDERLNLCLNGNQSRTIGNLVDIGYYDLMLLSSVLAEPQFANVSSMNLGINHGKQITTVLSNFYQDSTPEVLKKYYSQVHHLVVKSIEQNDNDVSVALAECAEINNTLKRTELLNFLFGEIQGMMSVLTKKQLSFKSSEFEKDCLRVKFTVSH